MNGLSELAVTGSSGDGVKLTVTLLLFYAIWFTADFTYKTVISEEFNAEVQNNGAEIPPIETL